MTDARRCPLSSVGDHLAENVSDSMRQLDWRASQPEAGHLGREVDVGETKLTDPGQRLPVKQDQTADEGCR